MPHSDPSLDSPIRGARERFVRPPLRSGDGARIEACARAAANASPGPSGLTPDEIDAQIQQFFTSDRF